MTKDGQRKYLTGGETKVHLKKETNRNMKTVDMKIVNNTENMDITIKGQFKEWGRKEKFKTE